MCVHCSLELDQFEWNSSYEADHAIQLLRNKQKIQMQLDHEMHSQLIENSVDASDQSSVQNHFWENEETAVIAY